MENVLEDIRKEAAAAKTEADLKVVEQKYLASSGIIKLKVRALKDLSPEDRKTEGPRLQALLADAEKLVAAKYAHFEKQKLTHGLQKDAEDLPVTLPKIGHLHPITEAVNMMNDLFIRMGYSIYDGPEIETDEFCFERLNVPKNHPARDMQDTIYVEEPNILLRTQTSSIEARALANLKPPFRIVCPGRVYRNEKPNKSNHFIFHQYQGVVVQERVSLKELFGTFTLLFQELYGPDVVVRFRNKYYPEVEPGVGPDMRCFNCQGKGCAVCKGVGWIEMGGAGIIHTKVLEAAGINSKKWMGFAFGLGLDRWVMAKYGITDIRTLLGGNLVYKYHEHEGIL